MSNVDEWVSAEFQNLAELINQYDQHLWLEWIPPEHQKDLLDKSKVFRIVDDRTNTIVMYADSLSNPQDILAQLWSKDCSKNDVVAQMDARNAAMEALRNKQIIDEREARKDFAAFVFKNTKSRWVHEGRVKDDEFRDLGPKQRHIT
jgi:hypothetical protein